MRQNIAFRQLDNIIINLYLCIKFIYDICTYLLTAFGFGLFQWSWNEDDYLSINTIIDAY